MEKHSMSDKYKHSQCPYCERRISSNVLHRHIKTHGIELWNQYKEHELKKKIKRVILLPAGQYKCTECDYCSQKSHSVASHWWLNHTEKGRIHSETVSSENLRIANKNGIAWNKGLTKETDARVMANGLANIGKISPRKGKTLEEILGSKEAARVKNVISEKLSINNKGGRAKWYTVAGQKVQGTWERDIALKLEELGIRWKKLKTNKDTLKYEMNGKTRSYTPDFYLADFDVYLEVKGYWWGRDREKMDIVLSTYLDKKIVIIEKEQYKKILEGELVW